MDFLDPKKERQNQIRLMIGYALVTLAIGIATLVLLYQAYGYGIDRQGNVTQSGILFVSSQPTGANISLNGQRYKASTNTKAVIPAGTYALQIAQEGYRTWQRQIVINGGDVQHFDYPFLFPKNLQTSDTALISDPSMATQSPDKRWILLGQTENSGSFTEYDLKNPAKPVTTTVALPAGSFTAGDDTGPQSWTLVEWAADSRHVLLQHTYNSKGTQSREFILLDRDTPANSVNLTTNLKLSQTETVNLFNNRTAQFYVYDSSNQSLQRISAADGSVISKLDHILAFKSYGDNELLYVTDAPPNGKAVSGQVTAVLLDGQKTITLRNLPASASVYDLNLAQYSGDWYIVVGASNDDGAYIYKNPQTQTVSSVDKLPAPWRRLAVDAPTYLAFSSNTQFIVAENGQEFAVYDLENVIQYHYHASEPIDQPQLHATWMDGDRLLYVSGGKLLVFDYDYRNRQLLTSSNPNYQAFFAQDYSYLYGLKAGSADGGVKPAFGSTPLTVK